MTATATKPRWIRFRDRYLAAVRRGEKTTTIRKARLIRSLKAGDRLILAFGNHAKPTLIEAVCTGIEPIGLPMDSRLMSDIAQRDGITRAELMAILDTDEPMLLIGFRLAE